MSNAGYRDKFEIYWSKNKHRFKGVSKETAGEIYDTGMISGIEWSIDLDNRTLARRNSEQVIVTILPSRIDEATKHITTTAANPAMRPVRLVGANNG